MSYCYPAKALSVSDSSTCTSGTRYLRALARRRGLLPDWSGILCRSLVAFGGTWDYLIKKPCLRSLCIIIVQFAFLLMST